MTETFEEVVTRIRKKLRDENRAKIDDLVHDLREYTYTGYHGWHFDLDHDGAVARIHKFIEEL